MGLVESRNTLSEAPSEAESNVSSHVGRRRFLKIGAVAGALSYLALFEPNEIVVERVEARLARLPAGFDGMRICALGDFHLHPFTTLPQIEAAIEAAQSLDADMIVLLGDYVDARATAIYELAPALARLRAPLGVHGILGNHDRGTDPVLVTRTLLEYGIQMHVNTGTTISRGGDELFLAGVNARGGPQSCLASTIANRAGGTPTLFLVHEPDFADTIATDPAALFQISGHTHGGQVRIPGLPPLRLPTLGRKYISGFGRVKDLVLYTNRGVGLADVPLRLNCPPEVTEITLRKADRLS